MDQYCKTWSKFSDLHGKGKIYRTSAVCCRVDTPRPNILDKPLKARSKLISIDLLLSLTIITVRDVVAARLCLAQVSVILFTRRGVCIPACTGADTPRQTHPGQTALPPGRHPPRQTPPSADTSCPVHAGIHTPLSSACWDTPSLVATEVDGTHPTGMHSWLFSFY